MGNTALQIERLMPGSIPDNGNVIFNSVVYSGGNIGYNGNGIITLGAPGVYSINWWVAGQYSLGFPLVFTLISSKGDAIKGDSPDIPGEVVGFGIINVITAPVTVRLANTSGAETLYSQSVPVKAGLTVTENSASAGPAGPGGPQGPAGPQGGQGPAGPQGTLANTSYCYSIRQLAYVLEQLIRIYTSNSWVVYTAYSSVSGTPSGLYKSPQGTDAGALIIGGVAVPLTAIKAVSISNAMYDNSISYLPAPSPLLTGCDTKIFASIQNGLPPLLSPVLISTSFQRQINGVLLKNEYGMAILENQSETNSLIFIPAAQITTYGPQASDPPEDEDLLYHLQHSEKKADASTKKSLFKKK